MTKMSICYAKCQMFKCLTIISQNDFHCIVLLIQGDTCKFRSFSMDSKNRNNEYRFFMTIVRIKDK